MIYLDGKWQKEPKTKNSYADKIRQAKPITERELWQAMTDRSYDDVAALTKQYYQCIYQGGYVSSQVRQAASLLNTFRKYKRKLGIANDKDGKRYVINAPSPQAKNWQEVWQSMTHLDYQTVFEDYLKCKRFRGYNKKYGKNYNLIRTFRRYCKRANIAYPTKLQSQKLNHPWQQPWLS